MRLHGAVDWTRRHVVSLSVGAGVVALHAGAYAFFAGRDPYSQTIFPACPLLHYFGIQCPGCGGTRAMYSLLHGDIATSIAMNPLVVAGYLSVAIALVGILIGKRGAERTSRWLYWAAAAIAIGATLWSAVIRNLLLPH
ncbi:hypothetical protein BKA04_001106 [Cryobacterium mesophilum]|uniref:DUF2752 domain-containing protein n=1 Tax=Terrimesophilobacter mesophilus TaxID=433647 RepID=A0A4V3I9I9_9MICO|nr:DUF2752 domain-containing protein [Terrimesophilobacter mesophilus]MBB5632883.1 hypothetical protein [Terrimesophilobacter mesophilus]TFB79658.1 DUF2752 domain-containing protein [Terrimesophilobacter mesophilus]